MSKLDINNVVTVSIANPPAGLADYKVNNLAILSKETPLVSITSYAVYRNTSDVATDWGLTSETYKLAANIFAQSPNILTGEGSLIIYPLGSGATLTDGITALDALIFFGGVLWAGYSPIDSEITAAAATMQALGRLIFVPDHLTAALNSGGLFNLITAAKQTLARNFLFTASATLARQAAAAYASRVMSVNFGGSNTTNTPHLKDLVNILPDDGINQTVLNNAQAQGVDLYINMAGIPKVFASGANDFTDNAYNLMWLRFALTVAGFNALATVSTKIPQTEPGMTLLKGEYLKVLEQAKTNGFIAAGAWNSGDLFGNEQDFRRNIGERGYYIYSQPVNKQLQTNRAARKAPLVQIAVKLAGAIHSTSVLVNVNV